MSETTTPAARPQRGDLLDLRIDSLAYGGNGVARHDGGYVVFVQGGMPGDLVRARVGKRKRSYAEARVEEILEPASDRIAPIADHPGAPWQVMPYERQLEVKAQQVDDALRRIGHLDGYVLEDIVPAVEQWRYRNKLEYSFGTDRTDPDNPVLVCGFHAPGSWEDIVGLEDSLLASDPLPAQILCIDNGSTDGTREYLGEQFPSLAIKHGLRYELVANDGNVGACTARNQGLGRATEPLVAFCDNDLVTRSRDWLRTLQESLEQEAKNGIVGPKLVYPFEPYNIECAGAAISRTGRVQYRGRGAAIGTPAYGVACEVQCLISACWLMKREITDALGGLDEVFNPAQFEDFDLCYRARENGWRVWYEPTAEMYHFENTSTAGSVDMKFKNDTKNGVFITTVMTNTSMTMTLWGTKVYDDIQAVSSAKRNIVPFDTLYDPSPTCNAQGGQVAAHGAGGAGAGALLHDLEGLEPGLQRQLGEGRIDDQVLVEEEVPDDADGGLLEASQEL